MTKSYIEEQYSITLPQDLKEFLNSWSDNERRCFKTRNHQEWTLSRLDQLHLKKCADYPYYLALKKFKEDGAFLGATVQVDDFFALGDDNGDFLFMNIKDFSLWGYWVSSDEFKQLTIGYKKLLDSELRVHSIELSLNEDMKQYCGEWHPLSECRENIRLFNDGSYLVEFDVGGGETVLIKKNWGIQSSNMVFKNGDSEDHVYTIKEFSSEAMTLVGPAPAKGKVKYVKKDTDLCKDLENKVIY